MSQIHFSTTGSSPTSDASYAVTMITSTTSPADNTSYFMVGALAWGSSTSAGGRIWIPKSGTLKSVYGAVNYAGSGSAENVIINIRLNNTTDYAITSTSQWTASPSLFSNSSMSVPVVAGDFISFTVVTPTWVTNPTTCTFSATAFIS